MKTTACALGQCFFKDLLWAKNKAQVYGYVPRYLSPRGSESTGAASPLLWLESWVTAAPRYRDQHNKRGAFNGVKANQVISMQALKKYGCD